MYGVPTKGVFDLNGMEEVAHTDLIYASLNAGPKLIESQFWGNSMARLFYIYYNDTRGLALTDNTGTGDKGPVSISTIGGDCLRAEPIRAAVADLLIWVATQSGDWGGR